MTDNYITLIEQLNTKLAIEKQRNVNQHKIITEYTNTINNLNNKCNILQHRNNYLEKINNSANYKNLRNTIVTLYDKNKLLQQSNNYIYNSMVITFTFLTFFVFFNIYK